MTYSEQLEREADRSRADVEETLDEIRARLKPGQLVDQLIDYARDGTGGEFYANLKRQIAENPLPVTVIGAGLAWLALSGNSAHPRRGRTATDYGIARDRAYGTVRDAERRAAELGNGVSNSLSDSMESATDRLSDVTRTASDTARRGTARVREAATSTGATLSSRVSSAYADATGAASRTSHAVAQSALSAGHSLADSSRSFVDFCRDQPLVLAGIGVALGAALGAVLPSTEVENRVMGDASDQAKERAQGMADEQIDKAKAIAEETADNITAGAQETVHKALDTVDTGQSARSDGQADGPATQNASSGDSDDIEWPTRDGSGRAADSGTPSGERPSNG
jgi:hypothetical protein